MAEIDDQILVVLGLLEQLIGQKCDMASQMQQGFLNLARSRQSMGSSKLNRYSFPFKFEPCATAELEDGRWHVRSDLTPETSPLKWYGVLVPKALRLCQSNFVKALEDALAVATLTKQLEEECAKLEGMLGRDGAAVGPEEMS